MEVWSQSATVLFNGDMCPGLGPLWDLHCENQNVSVDDAEESLVLHLDSRPRVVYKNFKGGETLNTSIGIVTLYRARPGGASRAPILRRWRQLEM